jgi:hypothetical protein
VFENRALTAIYGLNRGEVTWHWRKIHNKELYVLYSPNTIRATTSRWAGKVACMGYRIGVYSVWGGGKLREGDHMEGTGGRIILKWMF